MQADSILGLPEDESEALLERCWATVCTPDNVYEHQWQVGDQLGMGQSGAPARPGCRAGPAHAAPPRPRWYGAHPAADESMNPVFGRFPGLYAARSTK